MTSPFLTDPDQMRMMAGKFDAHSGVVQSEVHQMMSMTESMAGASWHGPAFVTHYDTVGEMQQALNNIVNMLQGVRDGLISNANTYEQQEHDAQTSLRT